MVRIDGVVPHGNSGRMLQTNDLSTPSGSDARHDLAGMTEEGLARAIQDQEAALRAAEAAFAVAREQLDRQRRSLRALQVEQNRRVGAEAADASTAGRTAGARKRSTTGMDAILGRDGVDPDAVLQSFRFLSLQREEVLLGETSSVEEQAIRFVDKDTGMLRSAATFGQARDFLDKGHTLGQPDIPLQRQTVWYLERGRIGRLRLDQVFVERRGEST
jgi:hypothetical protein